MGECDWELASPGPHGLGEEEDWPPPKNFSAITRGQRWKLWEEKKEKKKMSITILFVSQSWNFCQFQKNLYFQCLRKKNGLAAAILQGSLMSSFIHWIFTLHWVPYLTRPLWHLLPWKGSCFVSLLSAGTEFTMKAWPQDRSMSLTLASKFLSPGPRSPHLSRSNVSLCLASLLVFRILPLNSFCWIAPSYPPLWICLLTKPVATQSLPSHQAFPSAGDSSLNLQQWASHRGKS